MGSSYYKYIVYKEKNDKFADLSLNKDIIDGRLIAINNNYLAMSWSTGEIVIANSSKPCRITKTHPRIKYNYNKLCDIEFSPFNDKIIASAYDNNSVVLWKIPDEDIEENNIKELQIYKKHTKKVTYVTFNPVVDNVLCSGALGNEIHIWNPEKGDNYIEFKSVDNPSMISWNPNGDLVGVSTKNKFINIFDPRNNKMILRQNINDGIVPPKFGWIDNNLFVTTSYDNKKGKNMLKLWDIRNQNNNLLNEGEITSIKIDGSKSDILTPLINKELKIISVIVKGKTSNNAYIYNEGKFEKIKTYTSTPSICSVLLDRKYLDKKGTEMDIFANVTKDYKYIYYSSFVLPKNKPANNINLFPEENNIVLSYEEWFKGKNLDKNNDKGEIDNKNVINKEEKNKNNQSQQKIINKIDEKKQNNDDINKNGMVAILNSKGNQDKGTEKKTNEINTQNLKQKDLNKEIKSNNKDIDEKQKLYDELNKKYEELNKNFLEEQNKNKILNDEKNKIDKLYKDEKNKNTKLSNELNDLNKKNKEEKEKKNKCETENKELKQKYEKETSEKEEKEKL